MRQLAPQLLDFPLNGFEFSFLAFQKSQNYAGLFFQASWSEQINVGTLVIAAAEITQLDEAFFNQRLEAVIDLTKADPHGLSQFALTEIRVALKQLKDGQTLTFWIHGFREGTAGHVQNNGFHCTYATQ